MGRPRFSFRFLCYSAEAMAHLPRGISPELLVSQVNNTMPYLFSEESGQFRLPELFVPAKILTDFANSQDKELNHFEYFRLCVCCHYLTCATPVPTDVDIQIRRKLWPAKLPLEVALQMTDFVLESRKWDFRLVSRRFAHGAPQSPWKNEALSGHLGEWFTIIAGAYCALKQYADPLAQKKKQEVFEAIADEVQRHSDIFGSLWNAKEGLESLKASASIAHNFGDLDRVMDMWDLSVADPLRLQFYKMTSQPFDSDRKLRFLGRIWVGGQLYKAIIDTSSMAYENHRHFALRKPKCLRKHPDLMITTGPFFDSWGSHLARYFATETGEPSQEILEIVEDLKSGWDRLPKTLGYGRALRGILEVHPRITVDELNKTQRAILERTQDRFEKKWSEEALRELDDIPSRA